MSFDVSCSYVAGENECSKKIIFHFPHNHQYCRLSVGGLVFTVIVEFLMVLPFTFPVGLMLLVRVDGDRGLRW